MGYVGIATHLCPRLLWTIIRRSVVRLSVFFSLSMSYLWHPMLTTAVTPESKEQTPNSNYAHTNLFLTSTTVDFLVATTTNRECLTTSDVASDSNHNNNPICVQLWAFIITDFSNATTCAVKRTKTNS